MVPKVYLNVKRVGKLLLFANELVQTGKEKVI